jgi:hypothetical protein
MYFKIIRGLVHVKREEFFNFFDNPHFTRGNDFKLVKPIAKNNTLSNMFAWRCIGIWNELPNEVVNAPSAVSFKYKLQKINFNKYLIGRAYEVF